MVSKLNKIDEISRDLDLLNFQSNNERSETFAEVFKRKKNFRDSKASILCSTISAIILRKYK